MGSKGFSLVEVMVATAILGIVMAGIVTAFHEQLSLHSRQRNTSEMQQNVRTAMYFITRDLQMAGYDPVGTAGSGIQPVPGRHDAMALSMDVTGGDADSIDNDGDGETDNPQEEGFGDGSTDGPNEIIAYALNANKLTRASGNGSPQTLAANIDVLDFEYFGLNPLDPLCNTDCHMDINRAATNPDDIRIVQVSIIARAGAAAGAGGHQALDRSIYYTQVGKVILNKEKNPDRERRFMLSSEIRLRNQGLH